MIIEFQRGQYSAVSWNWGPSILDKCNLENYAIYLTNSGKFIISGIAFETALIDEFLLSCLSKICFKPNKWSTIVKYVLKKKIKYCLNYSQARKSDRWCCIYGHKLRADMQGIIYLAPKGITNYGNG